MKTARHTNQSVQKTSRPSSIIRPSSLLRSAPNKRPMIATVEKGKGAKPSSLKNASYGMGRSGHSQFTNLPMWGRRKLSRYSSNRVRIEVILSPEVKIFASVADQKDARLLPVS